LDRHAIDGADVELSRHDRRRHEAAASYGDAGLERPLAVEPPGQRPAVAVELVPADRETLGARFVQLGLQRLNRARAPESRPSDVPWPPCRRRPAPPA